MNPSASQFETGNLPKGWASARLEQVVGRNGLFVDGDWVETKDQNPAGDIRLVQLADVGDGIYKNKSNRFLTREKAIELNCTFLKPNDVLIARMPDPLGRACIFPGDPKDSITAVDVCIVRSGISGVNQKWLMFTTNSLPVRTVIASLQSGSTRKRISRKNLAKILFPIPPLAEQKRIVAKIEELFTKLDAGVEALKKVRQELKRYRQAVLKHAFEGKLTEQWREKNKDKIEPVNKLLERITKERNSYFEQKSKRQKKVKPISNEEISRLPQLPDYWGRQKLNDISFLITDGKHGDCRNKDDSGYYFISAKDIYDGKVNYEGARQILENDFEEVHKRTDLQPDDVLVTNAGTIGRIAIATKNEKTSRTTFQKSVAIIKKPNELINSKYLSYHLENDVEQIKSISKGTAQKNLLLGTMSELIISVCSIEEQKRVVEEIERHFSFTDQIEKTIEQALKQSDRLRQSILKKAFEGKLVPQDPEDEPAEKLLERIKAEKAKVASKHSLTKKVTKK